MNFNDALRWLGINDGITLATLQTIKQKYEQLIIPPRANKEKLGEAYQLLESILDPIKYAALGEREIDSVMNSYNESTDIVKEKVREIIFHQQLTTDGNEDKLWAFIKTLNEADLAAFFLVLSADYLKTIVTDFRKLLLFFHECLQGEYQIKFVLLLGYDYIWTFTQEHDLIFVKQNLEQANVLPFLLELIRGISSVEQLAIYINVIFDELQQIFDNAEFKAKFMALISDTNKFSELLEKLDAVDNYVHASQLLKLFAIQDRYAYLICLTDYFPANTKELLDTLSLLQPSDQIKYLDSLGSRLNAVVYTAKVFKTFLAYSSLELDQAFINNIGDAALLRFAPTPAQCATLMSEDNLDDARESVYQIAYTNAMLSAARALVGTCTSLVNENYLKKYPEGTSGHYRQRRASIITQYLGNVSAEITQNNTIDNIRLRQHQVIAKLFLHYASINDSHSKLSKVLETCLFKLLNLDPTKSPLKQQLKQHNSFGSHFACFFSENKRGEEIYKTIKSKLPADVLKLLRQDQYGYMRDFYKKVKAFDEKETAIFQESKISPVASL